MKDDHDWGPVHRSNYRMDLLNSNKWIGKANGLVRVVERIAPEVDEVWRLSMEWLKDRTQHLPSQEIFGIHLMLAAYAIENFLKGCIVANERRQLKLEFETKGKLPAVLKSHNLYRLAGRCGLTVADLEEEDLLRRLGHASIWYGRYPVPTDYTAYEGEQYSDGGVYNLRAFHQTDTAKVRHLVERIRTEFGISAG